MAIGARVKRASDQSVGNATYVALSFDTEERDDADFWEGVTNPTRLTVPAGQGGWYAVIAAVEFSGNAGGSRREIQLNLSGTATALANTRSPDLGTTDAHFVSVATIVYLAAGAYVEAFVYQNSGVSLNAVGGNGLTYAALVKL